MAATNSLTKIEKIIWTKMSIAGKLPERIIIIVDEQR